MRLMLCSHSITLLCHWMWKIRLWPNNIRRALRYYLLILLCNIALIYNNINIQGVSREDFEIIMGGVQMFQDVFVKGMVDTFDESIQPLLKLMSREILKQKKRLGGDIAVAHAVVSRYAT